MLSVGFGRTAQDLVCACTRSCLVFTAEGVTFQKLKKDTITKCLPHRTDNNRTGKRQLTQKRAI